MNKINSHKRTNNKTAMQAVEQEKQEHLKAELKKKIYVTSAMHSHLILADLDEILEDPNVSLFPKDKIDHLKSVMFNLVELNLGIFEFTLKKM